MPNYEMSDLALKTFAPTNRLIYDNNGLPSVMVEIPKMKMSDLIRGWSGDEVHPAFIVNEVELDKIYISKYQNCIINDKGYSLPAQPAANNMTFDDALECCVSKGAGWHLMTAAEYALIALICRKNGFLPWGNNFYGKDSRESAYTGIPCSYNNIGLRQHILTGSGAMKYSHNGDIDGIFDLNGNVSEWVGGKRIYNGELQLLVDNNAAEKTNPQTAASTTWKAINATTGAFMTPNGSGTTPNSIKIKKDENNNAQWSTTAGTGSCSVWFEYMDCDETISAAAKKVLMAYLLLPADQTHWDDDTVSFGNLSDEELFVAGGGYNSGNNAGVAHSMSVGPRSAAKADNIGFRCAYFDPSAIWLPEEDDEENPA